MPEYRDKSINDILDWLASIFGFQVSVANGFLSNVVMNFAEGYAFVFSFSVVRACGPY